MPLKAGHSPGIIAGNIREMVAAAMRKAGKRKKARKK